MCTRNIINDPHSLCLQYYTAPSGPPTSLTASALSSTSILITWQNPDEFDSNGIITTFEIVLIDSTDNIRHFTLPASIYLFHLESEF